MNRAKLHWSLFIEAKLHWGESEGVQGPPPIFPDLAVPGRAWPPLASPGLPWPPLAVPGLPRPPYRKRGDPLHGSGIPGWDPGIEILGSEIRVWESGSGIWDPGSRIRKSYLWVGGMRRSHLILEH